MINWKQMITICFFHFDAIKQLNEKETFFFFSHITKTFFNLFNDTSFKENPLHFSISSKESFTYTFPDWPHIPWPLIWNTSTSHELYPAPDIHQFNRYISVLMQTVCTNLGYKISILQYYILFTPTAPISTTLLETPTTKWHPFVSPRCPP